nr:helix-hairpin-helix domain-containing protein [Pseudomonas haemolytica]
MEERTALLALKGVGPTVITRLEQMGIESMDELAKAEVEDILAQASAALGSTCWKNSPQARAAITAAVELAKNRAKTSYGMTHPHGLQISSRT